MPRPALFVAGPTVRLVQSAKASHHGATKPDVFRSLKHPIPVMREHFSIPSVILACAAQEGTIASSIQHRTETPRVSAAGQQARIEWTRRHPRQ